MWWPFRRKTEPPPAKPERYSVAIPVPEGIDATAYARVPDNLWQTDPASAATLTRDKRRKIFEFDRERAEMAGCKSYIWRTAGDGDECEVCAKRNGKRFSYRKEPPHGHASICTACPQGYCRCYAEPIIPE